MVCRFVPQVWGLVPLWHVNSPPTPHQIPDIVGRAGFVPRPLGRRKTSFSSLGTRLSWGIPLIYIGLSNMCSFSHNTWVDCHVRPGKVFSISHLLDLCASWGSSFIIHMGHSSLFITSYTCSGATVIKSGHVIFVMTAELEWSMHWWETINLFCMALYTVSSSLTKFNIPADVTDSYTVYHTSCHGNQHWFKGGPNHRLH